MTGPISAVAIGRVRVWRARGSKEINDLPTSFLTNVHARNNHFSLIHEIANSRNIDRVVLEARHGDCRQEKELESKRELASKCFAFIVSDYTRVNRSVLCTWHRDSIALHDRDKQKCLRCVGARIDSITLIINFKVYVL